MSAGLALVSGIVAARDTVLEETAMAVGELRNQVIRTRQLLWFHQRGLARALHGPVQSAVTAAALRLDDAARNDAISPSVVDAVRADLMRTLDVPSDSDASTTSLDDGIARIVGTWEGVCDVNAAIDERSSAVLDTDPVLRACVMDVLTDATSNAVRHGRAAHVTIALTCDAAALALAIQDDGSAPIQATRSGLGTTLLDDCALSWSLTQDDRGHRLQVLLPTPEGFTSLGGTSGGGN